MPVHIIVGTQWGDEGKGRIADLLASRSDIVARYGGGDNAGHTIQVGDDNFKLHLVPSGVLYPNVVCVLGGGMVINPLKLVQELKALDARGVDISPGRIRLAETAHIITPGHIALDGAKEAERGGAAIGTTQRGIGPAYTDKIARQGIRAGLMRRPDVFAARVAEHVEAANRPLTVRYDADSRDAAQAGATYAEAAEFLAPYLADVPLLLHRALGEGKTVLCEGAQGTLLDVDHGTYPFVTSSNPTAGGVFTGLGIGPRHVERVVGVMKAYSTRVGAGPFPTELEGDLAQKLRGTGDKPWDEFGTTTGRPRRCGWLDTVVVRYAARINGLTELTITKLDILSGFDTIRVADEYRRDGVAETELPTDGDLLAACQPVYHERPGWSADIMDETAFESLPENAQAYVQHVEELTGLPVRIITVGPARHQTIER